MPPKKTEKKVGAAPRRSLRFGDTASTSQGDGGEERERERGGGGGEQG